MGNADGIGAAARFDSPRGIALDSSGNLFLADTGNDRITKGIPVGPYFQVFAATGISGSVGTLNGTVNPNGHSTAAWFEYGLTTSYGNTVAVTLSPDNGVGVQNVSVQVSGLLPATTYHYRLTGTSSESTGSTADMAFTTPAGSPEVEVEQPAGNGLSDGTALVNFSDTPLGVSSVKTFIIRNSGTAALTGLSVGRAGAHISNFAVSPLSPTSLAAGASTIFTVTFTPSAAGLRTAALRIASNVADENPFDISLTGMGLAPDIEIEQPAGTNLMAGVSIVDFGIVPAGYPVTQTIRIRNAGTVDLTGITATLAGSNPSDYAILQAPPEVLASGSSASFTLRFVASSADSPSAILRIVSNDPDENPFDITLTGEAVGAEISLEQAAGRPLLDGTSVIDFGGVSIGTPVIRSFSIRNAGNLDLTGISVVITGVNSTDFALVSSLPASLAPDASVSFGVRFTAGGGGNRLAQLRISSSDADENPFDVSLAGTGLALSDDWRLNNFGFAENAGIAADSADPDGDGIVNLLEYALGGNPTMAAATPLPTVGINAATGRLELRFNRFPERADISLKVERADSVGGPWTSLARSIGGGTFSALIADIEVAESGSGTSRAVTVGVPFPLPNAAQSHRFLRLRATR